MEKKSNVPLKNHLSASIKACIANGEALLDDILCLEFQDRESTRHYLAVIAQEEFAKAFLLFLVHERVIPWSRLLVRAMHDHTCKHLVCSVLNYLNPPLDETYEQMKTRIHADVALGDALPIEVADAISMLRHEKIGRWESSSWWWEEDPNYDGTARKLAEGSRDRLKQDSLYVRIGADGRVVSSPAQPRVSDCSADIERAKSYASFLKMLLEDERLDSSPFERTKSFFAALFAE